MSYPSTRIRCWIVSLVSLAAMTGARFTLPAGGSVEKSEPLFAQTDVFAEGEAGYHTFRIPALAVSRKGTLLAFCEGRKQSSADHGDIDLVLKRSFDDGKTWGPLQIIHEAVSYTHLTLPTILRV